MDRNDRLKMLAVNEYVKAGDTDPILFYKLPVVGMLYRRRVELCLGELSGGERVLEIGFGSGVTFLNLADKYKEIHGLDLNADAEAVSEVFKELKPRLFLKNGNALKMPYPDNYFDSVLLISILEHLKPGEQKDIFNEIRRVIKKNGQVIYGSPIDRPFMKLLFRVLGYDIDKLHFSTEKDIAAAARSVFAKVKIMRMRLPLFGGIYEVGHFTKA